MYVCTYIHVGEEIFPLNLQGSSGWSKNQMDKRENNRRKVKFNYIQMRNPHRHEIPKTGKMRYICFPKLRRRGMGSGTSRRRKAIHRKMKNYMFGKQMFTRSHKKNGPQRIFNGLH